MTQITDHVYLGNSSDANNPKLINENGITAILNCAIDLDCPAFGKVQQKFGMYDGPGNPLIVFMAATVELGRLVDLGHKVLVHCHEGRSRSASVVAAHIGIRDGMTLEDAIQFIQSARHEVLPHEAMAKLAGRTIQRLSREPLRGGE